MLLRVWVLGLLAVLLWAGGPVYGCSPPINRDAWNTTIAALAGEVVVGSLAQGERDLALSVLSEDGVVVGTFDSFSFGAEPVAIRFARDGAFTLRVRATDGKLLPSIIPRPTLGCRPYAPDDEPRFAAIAASTEAKHMTEAAATEEFEQALQKKRDAARIWISLGDRSAAARTLLGIGELLYSRSLFPEAVKEFRDSIRMAAAAGDRRTSAEGKNDEGLAAMQLGDAEMSLGLLRAALTDWNALHLPFGESATAANLGLLSWRMGLFNEALTYHQRALSVFLRLGEKRGAALARNNLGLTYASLNRPALALQELRRARQTFHELNDVSAEGQALVNIGYLELLSHDTRAALLSQQAAVELLRDSADVKARSDALTNLAKALADTRPQESLRLLDEALKSYEEMGDRRGQASALHHKGTIHAARGDENRALLELERAAELRLEIRIPDAAAESMFESAKVMERQGRLDDAAAQLSQVVNIAENLRASSGGESFRTSYFASKQVYFENYADVLMKLGRSAEALEVTERARARTLLDILAASQTRFQSSAPRDLLARRSSIEQLLSFQSQQLVAVSRSKPDPVREAGLRNTIDGLLAERDLVESEIRQADPEYAELWMPKTVGLNELQRQLDDQSELLEFALGETSSYLWVVTHGTLRAFRLPPRKQLEVAARKIVKFSPEFTARQREVSLAKGYSDTLSAMARQLFGPAGGSLGRKRWIIVPDGVLHYLPFAALRLSAGGTAAREDGETMVLPSASVLSALRRNESRRRSTGAAAIFADPVFDSLDPRVAESARTGSADTAAGQSLARLPYSRSEAESIAALVRGKRVLLALDFEASRKALMSRTVGGFRILHISTHTFVDDVRPELSRIALSQVDQQGKQVDGSVRLFDIYSLDLSGTELVVLSGCGSGAGQYAGGEGLIGLARGFFHAGAGAVLATLWAVDDQASQELMRRFYEASLKDRLQPAAALARAQREMRADRRWSDPYYWAGFVLLAAPPGPVPPNRTEAQ